VPEERALKRKSSPRRKRLFLQVDLLFLDKEETAMMRAITIDNKAKSLASLSLDLSLELSRLNPSVLNFRN
jgi:hypothetical protein